MNFYVVKAFLARRRLEWCKRWQNRITEKRQIFFSWSSKVELLVDISRVKFYKWILQMFFSDRSFTNKKWTLSDRCQLPIGRRLEWCKRWKKRRTEKRQFFFSWNSKVELLMDTSRVKFYKWILQMFFSDHSFNKSKVTSWWWPMSIAYVRFGALDRRQTNTCSKQKFAENNF